MLGKAIGIDFGTSSIKFYKNGEGIILHEKSVIAIYNKSHTFAVGNEAYEMYEKAPANIQVSYPVKNGVIADIGAMFRDNNINIISIVAKPETSVKTELTIRAELGGKGLEIIEQLREAGYYVTDISNVKSRE